MDELRCIFSIQRNSSIQSLGPTESDEQEKSKINVDFNKNIIIYFRRWIFHKIYYLPSTIMAKHKKLKKVAKAEKAGKDESVSLSWKERFKLEALIDCVTSAMTNP